MQGQISRRKKEMKNCKLCKAEVLTKRFKVSDEMEFWAWCANCLSCKIPMVVHKEHKKKFSEQEKQQIMEWAEKNFGGTIHIRWKMRSIPNHAHCHIVVK